MEAVLVNMRNTNEAFRIPGPEVCYTDKCCQDRPILTKCFETLRDKYDLPLLQLPDAMKVTVISTSDKDINETVLKIIADSGLQLNKSAGKYVKLYIDTRC